MFVCGVFNDVSRFDSNQHTTYTCDVELPSSNGMIVIEQ